MIIFGTTTLNSTLEKGQFYCPRCSSSQEYKTVGANRFFTLYFIPLIPMGRAGTYVECLSCGGTYAEEILHYDPAQERIQAMVDFRRILILGMLATGKVDQINVYAFRKVFESVSQESMDEQTAHEELRLAREAGVDPMKAIETRTDDLSFEGKGMVLQCLLEIVAPKGPVTEGDRMMLSQIANVMNYPSTQVDSLIEGASQERLN